MLRSEARRFVEIRGWLQDNDVRLWLVIKIEQQRFWILTIARRPNASVKNVVALLAQATWRVLGEVILMISPSISSVRSSNPITPVSHIRWYSSTVNRRFSTSIRIRPSGKECTLQTRPSQGTNRSLAYIQHCLTVLPSRRSVSHGEVRRLRD